MDEMTTETAATDERPIRCIAYGEQFIATDDSSTLGMSATGPDALESLAMRLFQAGFGLDRRLVVFRGGERVGSITIGAAAKVNLE